MLVDLVGGLLRLLLLLVKVSLGWRLEVLVRLRLRLGLGLRVRLRLRLRVLEVVGGLLGVLEGLTVPDAAVHHTGEMHCHGEGRVTGLQCSGWAAGE